MKILITGGLGFIYSHVAERLCDDGHDITIIDGLLDGSNKELIPIFKEKGINILEEIILNGVQHYLNIDDDYDIFIHAAAESNVDKSIGDVMPFLGNIDSTIGMLELAKNQKNLKCFYMISTDEVHGSTVKYADGTETNPQNPYSASKMSCENFAMAYRNTYDVPVHIIRMCNVIGKRQDDTKLIPRAITLIENGDTVPVYGDGKATREYIDVRDVCEFFSKLIRDKFEIVSTYYDPYKYLTLLTNNQELSIIEVLFTIGQVLDKKVEIVQSERLGHDMHYRMKSTTKTDNYINFVDTIKWILTK